jgi:hypothetical protein
MQIQLCKKSVEARGDLVAQLGEREHTVVLKDCLNRCQGCQLGLVIALVEGAPVSTRTTEAFLAEMDEAEEFAE